MSDEPTFCPYCGATELGEYSGEVTWECGTTSWDDGPQRDCLRRAREQRLIAIVREGIDLGVSSSPTRDDWNLRAEELLAALLKEMPDA